MRRPVVLVMAGHDPSGGAGVTADAETLAVLGCHACQLITALTEQDSTNVYALWPQPPDAFLRQADRVVRDMPPAVIKIGLIGSEALIHPLVDWLNQPELADVPVVFDPVLAAGGGALLGAGQLESPLVERLLPRCHVLTPNVPEARRLSGQEDLESAVAFLLEHGSHAVLLTGTHAAGRDVIHSLHTREGLVRRWRWPRLEGEYHGSGCTLASALAAFIARGFPLEEAVLGAQRYTWQSLRLAHFPGRGQGMPMRLR